MVLTASEESQVYTVSKENLCEYVIHRSQPYVLVQHIWIELVPLSRTLHSYFQQTKLAGTSDTVETCQMETWLHQSR